MSIEWPVTPALSSLNPVSSNGSIAGLLPR
jgi:hypothetical protein